MTEAGPRHPPGCIVCTRMGLRRWAGDGVMFGEVWLDERHEGTPGYAHGGAIAALLDDLMGTVPQLHGWLGVTGKLEITYRAPGLLGHRYELRAELGEVEGRRATVSGEMRGPDGVIATAQGTWIRVEREHFVETANEGGDGLPW